MSSVPVAGRRESEKLENTTRQVFQTQNLGGGRDSLSVLPMWDAVVTNLKKLKGIDRQCQAFGARRHRYVLRPRCSESEIATVEHKLGVPLPQTLRTFYKGVGNGVAGPNYGLTPAEELTGFRPTEVYPGIYALREIATSGGRPPDEDGYFEVPLDKITGLLNVIDQGCGHQTCLIAIGPSVGLVAHVSADGCVVETDNSLIEIYLQWLQQEIERFATVESLMRAGWSYQRIKEELMRSHSDYRAADRIVSIADVKKPVALFGDGNHQIHHGATQSPWYQQVLTEWQRRNLPER